MTITKNDARQDIASAYVDFGFADLETGISMDAIKVPSGAVLCGGSIEITEVFNSLTSDTLTVGDSVTADEYVGAVNGTVLGLTALVPTGKEYTPSDDITVGWTGVGTAPTTGAGRLTLHYIALRKSDFTQD